MKDPVLGRWTARKRAGKAVPAAAIAATLAAGAAAWMTIGSGSGAPSELTAAMAKAPAAGLTIPAAASSPASRTGSASGTAPTFSHAIAGNMSATRRVLASVASKAAPRQASAAQKPSPAATVSRAATLSCNTASGMLPANVTAIVTFLLAHGYSHNAAAGIAGNMYQESKGDPESVGMGGGGLIGFTPLPAGYVTGNPAVDLQTQLQAVLTYNQQWAAYLPALNSAASPASAAYIYVTDFERAGIPAASTREASADAVASACGI